MMGKPRVAMGWTAALALTLVAGACQQAEPPAPEGVAWITSMDAALADAQKQGRPILLSFYTDW
jgi:thiol:disulfide interchange protein